MAVNLLPCLPRRQYSQPLAGASRASKDLQVMVAWAGSAGSSEQNEEGGRTLADERLCHFGNAVLRRTGWQAQLSNCASFAKTHIQLEQRVRAGWWRRRRARGRRGTARWVGREEEETGDEGPPCHAESCALPCWLPAAGSSTRQAAVGSRAECRLTVGWAGEERGCGCKGKHAGWGKCEDGGGRPGANDTSASLLMHRDLTWAAAVMGTAKAGMEMAGAVREMAGAAPGCTAGMAGNNAKSAGSMGYPREGSQGATPHA